MIMRFFDFEVTPNWWLCVFGDMPENESDVNDKIKDKFVIINSDMPNARDLLIRQLREENFVMTGYNIKGYDLVIANAIYNAFTPQEVKIVNDLIINPGCAWSTKEHMRLQPFAKRKLRGICYQDLLDDNDGSLKEKEAILGLNIMESSVDFNKEDLTEQDKDEMTYYCKHDVYASMYYYLKVMKGYVKNKLAIGRKFGIPERDCYMCTNANLVSRALGAKRATFPDADKKEIELPSKIRQYCYDNLPSKVIDKIRNDTNPFEIDLFDNKAVRLYKGDYAQMTIYNDNPLSVARDFENKGAEWVHLVDLEGAKDGTTPNIDTIKEIVKNCNLFTEVGGGIRSMEVIEKYINAGVDRVILGTAAVNDEEFLKKAFIF